MVPMHYGSFRLSYEPVEEPVPRLVAAAVEHGVERNVCVLEEGVTKFFDKVTDCEAVLESGQRLIEIGD
jgi:hypothetical protein